MQYIFFDTAVNGYYTLDVLKKKLNNFVPLIDASEKISDDVAPFIFEINDRLLEEIFSMNDLSLKEILLFESPATILEIQNHFRRFTVQKINDRQFYFRFWSAIIFKKFITGCEIQQLKEFFGPVQKFICAGVDGAFSTQFSFNGKQLLPERLPNRTILSPGKEAGEEQYAAETGINRDEKKPPRKFIY